MSSSAPCPPFICVLKPTALSNRITSITMWRVSLQTSVSTCESLSLQCKPCLRSGTHWQTPCLPTMTSWLPTQEITCDYISMTAVRHLICQALAALTTSVSIIDAGVSVLMKRCVAGKVVCRKHNTNTLHCVSMSDSLHHYTDLTKQPRWSWCIKTKNKNKTSGRCSLATTLLQHT